MQLLSQFYMRECRMRRVYGNSRSWIYPFPSLSNYYPFLPLLCSKKSVGRRPGIAVLTHCILMGYRLIYGYLCSVRNK